MITKKYNDKMILFLFIFIIIIIIGINIIFKASYSKKNINLATAINNHFSSSDNIGCFLTDKEELFLFLDNNDFYWFKSYNNLNEDYYIGTYNYKNGDGALEELGYTKEEFKEEFGENIDITEVYSFNIFPTISNNSSENIYPSDNWWFLIVKQDNYNAMAFNRTLGVRYNLTKINN